MKSDSFGILVAGMHRSGTSATAGALHHLGVTLGDKLMAGAEDNPKGYFEHEGVVAIHDLLLRQLGSWWSDPRPLPQGWLGLPDTRRAEDALVALVREDFALASVWAVKDPRVCRLLPLWRRCLERIGVAAGVLHVVRSPPEVAASLRARDGFDIALGELLWLQHVVAAIRDSQGMPRAIVLYDELLANPADVMRKAIEELLTTLPMARSEHPALLADFVDATHRHHTASAMSGTSQVSILAAELFGTYEAVAAGRAEWSDLDAHCDRFDELWAGMAPFVGAMANAMFPALEDRYASQSEVYRLRSELHAQVEWAKQAVVQHQGVDEERVALIAQLHEARQALTLAQAEQARVQSDLHGQVRWAEQAVAEHRGVVEARDALASQLQEAREGRLAAQAEQSRLQSELHAQVRWAEQAVVEHRGVLDAREALAAELTAVRTALVIAQAEQSRLQADLQASQAARDLAREEFLGVRAGLALANAELEKNHANLADLHRELDRLRAAQSALQGVHAEVSAIRNDLATMLVARDNEIAALRAQISALTSSASWRWTAPLRALRRGLASSPDHLPASPKGAVATPVASPQHDGDKNPVNSTADAGKKNTS